MTLENALETICKKYWDDGLQITDIYIPKQWVPCLANFLVDDFHGPIKIHRSKKHLKIMTKGGGL